MSCKIPKGTTVDEMCQQGLVCTYLYALWPWTVFFIGILEVQMTRKFEFIMYSENYGKNSILEAVLELEEGSSNSKFSNQTQDYVIPCRY